METVYITLIEGQDVILNLSKKRKRNPSQEDELTIQKIKHD